VLFSHQYRAVLTPSKWRWSSGRYWNQLRMYMCGHSQLFWGPCFGC